MASVDNDRGVERARQVSDEVRRLSADHAREIRDELDRQSGQRAAREVSGNAADDYRKVEPGPSVQRNVDDLVQSSGFKSLAGDQQRQMLEAQSKNPEEGYYTDDLRQLAG